MKYLGAALMCLILVPAWAMADPPPTLTTVYAIQQGDFSIGDSVMVDSVVVTAVDNIATTYGFNVQERGGGRYSGILCYLGYDTPDVEVGDLVRVWGYYDEYTNHSEIQTEDGQYEIIQEDYGAPACTLLSCEDLGNIPPDSLAETWEGVLVCVDTVVVISLDDWGEYQVSEAHVHPGDHGNDSVRVDDKLLTALPRPLLGDTLVTVRGVFAEEHDNYRIWPRSTSDVVYLHGSPPPSVVSAYATSNTSIQVEFDMAVDELTAEDEDNYSIFSATIISADLDLSDSTTVVLTTDTQPAGERDSIIVCDVASAAGSPMSECAQLGFRAGITPISDIQTPDDETDASPMDGERITTTGIVVNADSAYDGPFFIQAKAGGPWSGVYVYAFPVDPYDVGDSVVVSGYVQEYYNWTEISGVDYIEWAGTGVSFNGPTVVTPDQIKTGSATAESYESVFIKMDSVEVYTFLDGVGEWDCGTGTDTVAVGDFTCVYNPCYDYPGLGSWIRITGPVRFHYAEFKIEPRKNSDIEVLEPCQAGVKGDERAALRLSQNAPNPFAGETMIKFSVPRGMQVSLSVYDVSGRLVRTVADGAVDAGEHIISWDGKDSQSRDVGPGIYFVRMSTPERSFQKKMVLLK
jgi:hypothetical protein